MPTVECSDCDRLFEESEGHWVSVKAHRSAEGLEAVWAVTTTPRAEALAKCRECYEAWRREHEKGADLEERR
jgi:hypothetical protein